MQIELDGETHALEIEILGVNVVGQELNNPVICSGRDIPWLQDVTAEDAWGTWGVTLRDVYILDPQNQVLHVFNLTVNSLTIQANYDALKALLVAAANPAP